MKIERLEGNRRVRVFLTENDLNEMNINIRTLTSDSPELSDFLYKIMEYVNRETGFNPSSGQIVIEASPSDGGVILTVTRISPLKKTVKPAPRNVTAKKRNSAKKLFRFADFEALTAYLSAADGCILSDMSLYSYNDTFFIVSDNTDAHITEFADRLIAFGTNDVFLSEHAKIIAANDDLVKMANGIKELTDNK